MIDHATIQRIMDAADIVDVVKEFVTLHKAGQNFKGLCPFHNEKTPSFVVSPAKQYCKCFSCGKGGNVVHFIMEHEQMTYPEALRWLAKKYNIEIAERELTPEEKLQQSERESMFAVNEWANKYFQDNLRNHADGVALGLAYLRQRGFRDDTIKKFRLGYALEERDATARAALAKGFSEKVLEQTGLCYRTDDGRLLDRYHGRVIFPVQTVSGMTVAFGGRILSSEKTKAKYVNSPESSIYSKSHELYGLYLAKQAIMKEDCCYLVEGYTDVISMHQSGVENVVASSGTSLTEGQIRLIHRFTSNITILYDGDSAGEKASNRAIDMLLAEGMNIKVLFLPDGDDPDSFARKHRAEEFRTYINDHQTDFITFKAKRLLAQAGNDPQRRATLVTDIVQSIAVIPDAIVRQMYVSECARLLSVSEQLILSEVAKRLKPGSVPTPKAGTEGQTTEQTEGETPAEPTDATSAEPQADKRIELILTVMVMRYGTGTVYVSGEDGEEQQPITVAQYIESDLQADGLSLTNPLYQEIITEAAKLPASEDAEQTINYFLSHPNAEISTLASRHAEDKYILSTKQEEIFVHDKNRLCEIVPRLMHDYKNSIIRAEMKSVLRQLSDPQTQTDPEKSKQLMERYRDLSEMERAFALALGERVLNIY